MDSTPHHTMAFCLSVVLLSLIGSALLDNNKHAEKKDSIFHLHRNRNSVSKIDIADISTMDSATNNYISVSVSFYCHSYLLIGIIVTVQLSAQCSRMKIPSIQRSKNILKKINII